MARYTGPSNKLYRNFGVKDLSNRKLTSSMRTNPSGQHGAMRKKPSDYALQLKEKQKIRLTYLVSDNVIFRAGFAITRKQARQIVNHAHILVNGKKVDVPSYLLKAGDVVTVKESSKEFIKAIKESIDMALNYAWLTVDYNSFQITFDRVPNREEMDPEFKEQLVIEYYSK